MIDMDKNSAELIERIVTEREALKHENKELKELVEAQDITIAMLNETIKRLGGDFL